jgi:intracellular multiplication protein IcmO
MEDTVINRRILLVLLPALETSPSSLASLGRITLAAQKSMMAKSLGDKLAGSTAKNLANRVTSSPTSFMSDNDEVGYYLVEGTAVAAAQARSIGFALMYCAQDLSAMRR